MPILYNFLSIAYSTAGQIEQAEVVTKENYRQNPDDLFARVNYAEFCLAKGDYEKVAEIFEHKFDPKQLYPKRKEFHISEVINFMGIIGVYFFETGQEELAKQYYDVLNQIGPDYPMAKRLHRKLYPGPLRRLWGRLTDQAS
jgi:tetratricopeptide (TPR) repeat protein